MPESRAELSSIASSLETLTERVAALAEDNSLGGNSDLATELFEVERAMMTASRRLNRAIS